MHPDPTSSSHDASTGRLKRLGRGVLYGLGGVIGLAILCVVLVLLALQTNRGARTIARPLLESVVPLQGARLEIGSIDGSFIRSLNLGDVRIVEEDGSILARIDTVHARYRLLPLFRRTVAVERVQVGIAEISMHQGKDGTWDLLRVLPGDTTAVEDTTASAWSIRIDQADLALDDLQAHFYAQGRDSVLQLGALDARLRALQTAPSFTAHLDTLHTRFLPPGTTDTVRVALGADVEAGRVTVGGLRLTSALSEVCGHGVIPLPGDSSAGFGPTSFVLTARPFALRDVHPFWASVDPDRLLDLELDIRGEAHIVSIQAAVDVRDGGGTFRLEGQGTPSARGPVQADLTATADNLDLNVFLSANAANRFTGRIETDLEGSAWETVSGSARITVDPASRVSGIQPAPTVLTAEARTGTFDVSVETGLQETVVSLNGTLRPFAPIPSYRVQGDIRHLNVATLQSATSPPGATPETEPMRSDLNLNLQVEGRGTGGDSTKIDAALRLAPSHWNGVPLDGRLAAILNEGVLDVETGLAVGVGRLEADGTFRFGDEAAYRLDVSRLEAIPIAALIGDTTQSSLSGTLALEAEGSMPDQLRGHATVHLYDTVFGPLRVQTADVTASVQEQAIALQAQVDLQGGQMGLEARLASFTTEPRYAVEAGWFENVDVGALVQDTSLSSTLNGTFSVEGHGMAPDSLTGRARLVLERSLWNRQVINAASLTADVERGSGTMQTVLELPGGTARLAGRADWAGPTVSYALETGRIEGIDLGALTGNSSLATDLNARLSLEGRGTAPEEMEADLRLDVERSTVNDAVVRDGTLQLGVNRGRGTLEARLATAEGRVTLQGSGRFEGEQPSYELHGAVQGLDPAMWMGQDSLPSALFVEFDATGRGVAVDSMTLDGTVQVDSARYGAVRVGDALLRLNLDRGRLQVDTLYVASNVATLTGGGRVALVADTTAPPSDFRLDLTVDELWPLRSILQADALSLLDGSLAARITGPPGAPHVRLQTELSSLSFNTVQLAELTATLEATLDDAFQLDPASGRLDAELTYLNVAGQRAEHIEIGARYAEDAVLLDLEVQIDDRRDFTLAGRIDPMAERRGLELERFDLRTDQNQWQLLQPVAIWYGDTYEIENLLLSTTNQQLAIDGIIDPDGQQDFTLTAENLQLEAVGDLLGFTRLRGTLDASFKLNGPAAAPNLDGDLLLDISSADNPGTRLDLSVAYDSLRLDVTGELLNNVDTTGLFAARRPPPAPLRMEGYIPLDLTLRRDSTGAIRFGSGELPNRSVEFEVTADSFTVDGLNPLLEPTPLRDLRGALFADMQISGEVQEPVLDGTARIAHGRVDLPEFGVTYRDIRTRLVLESNQVRLEELALNADGGSLTGSGRVDLSELTLGSFDLTLQADDFPAIQTAAYQVTADADLDVSGSTDAPVVTGTVELVSADFSLPETSADQQVGEVELSVRDVEMLRQYFGVQVSQADTSSLDLYDALVLDINLEISRDTWLRSEQNPEMDIEFTGDLDLQKTPGSDLQIFGSVSVVSGRSRVVQFGKAFDLTTGTLTFNGNPADPILDVEGVYEVPSRGNTASEVTITLSLEGQLDSLDLTLSSEPSMELASILSYIAFGRPAGEAFQLRSGGGTEEGGQNGVLTQSAGLALGQLASYVEGVAGSELGLDVIEIEQDGLQGTLITAGKYVSPRLYVAVSQPISLSGSSSVQSDDIDTQVTLEYALLQGLLVKMERTDAQLRLNLRWENAY